MKISLKGLYKRYRGAGADKETIGKIIRSFRNHDYEPCYSCEVESFNKKYPGCKCFSIKCKTCGFTLIHFLNFKALPGEPDFNVIEKMSKNVLSCEEYIIKDIVE